MPSSVKPERLKYYKIYSGSHGQWYAAMRKYLKLSEAVKFNLWETAGTRDTHPALRNIFSLVQSRIPIYLIYWYKLETAALVGVVLHVKCPENKAFWVQRWEVSSNTSNKNNKPREIGWNIKTIISYYLLLSLERESYWEKLQFLPIFKNSNFQLF